MELSIGQVVKSKAGRDKDNCFIVINVIDENFVVIADGCLRSIHNPKKKNLKHLIVFDVIIDSIKDKLLDNSKVLDANLKNEIKKIGLF